MLRSLVERILAATQGRRLLPHEESTAREVFKMMGVDDYVMIGDLMCGIGNMEVLIRVSGTKMMRVDLRYLSFDGILRSISTALHSVIREQELAAMQEVMAKITEMKEAMAQGSARRAELDALLLTPPEGLAAKVVFFTDEDHTPDQEGRDEMRRAIERVRRQSVRFEGLMKDWLPDPDKKSTKVWFEWVNRLFKAHPELLDDEHVMDAVFVKGMMPYTYGE